ncbi:glycoside hydrolase family 19 protein [Deinococcus marmoris]|uniref:Phage endolysin n=1 Tax=Deinococcus marmoris TaxID=249408 RepID=A0A1U7P2X5_9DEIO|nr:glycoside hydrolase family 19 protein [Deinococcus marmoris]OLV19522.1 Phage endolysin [Deinococcus marmoris]
MRYTITPDIIRRAVPRHPDPQAAAAALDEACERYGVTTRPAVAMLLAQLTHESSIMPVSENLNYSTEAMMGAWDRRFPTVASTLPYVRNPVKLGNYAYGGRMGNVNPGDGFLFRGRGYMQITGRDMYRAIGRAIGLDLESQPDLLLTHRASALSALELCKRKGLLGILGGGDVDRVSRTINGGDNGLKHRAELYHRFMQIFPAEQTAPVPPARSTSVFLTHSGEPPVRSLWDGKPGGIYGGHALDEAFFGRVRAMYPNPGTYPHGGLQITVADDGALILARL